jgi:hypothetical protein
MSAVRNFAPAVDMTLLNKSFAVVRSAMGVEILSEYYNKLPPTLSLVSWGSVFWGWMLTHM